jgi:uncharacterized protein
MMALRRDGEMDVQDMQDIAKARVLILSDGRTGAQNRSLGVAEMLGIKDPEVVTMTPKYSSKLLRLLPVSWLYEDYDRLVRDVRDYDVVITAGYQISRVLSALKKNDPRLFAVVLMRPAGRAKHFDVVAVEQHDRYPAANNVVVTLGAPNRITRDKLALEADRWRKRLSHVRGTKVALLVGGTSKRGRFGVEDARTLIRELATVFKENGSGLLVTTSRRTGKDVTDALESTLKTSGIEYFMWSPEEGGRDNPYLAYLALADAVVVTADSVSMVSEAASAGKPVYLWGDEKALPRKLKDYYTSMIKQGRVRWWQGKFTLRPPAAGLMDTMMVAGFVRSKWMKRNRTL